MWEQLNRTDFGSLYTAACLRATAAAVIPQDSKTPVGEANKLAKEEADRAMSWLQQSVAAGLSDHEKLEKNAALIALREHDDFKKLLAEMKSRPAKKP